MNGIVTRRFLQRRFWTATLMLLVTLTACAGVAVLALRGQVERSNYLFAFHYLHDATTRLELEFARLSLLPDDKPAERKWVRAAFGDLLAEFRAISLSDPDRPVRSAGRSAGVRPGRPRPVPEDHLADLAAEFGVEAARALERNGLAGQAMPTVLAEIWEPDETGGRAGAPPALETEIARLLRLSAPLVRAEGPLSPTERRQVRELEALSLDRIRPALDRIAGILAAQIDDTTSKAMLFVLILSGLGVAAALLNFVTIFRPLERAVMQSQAEIIAQRDKAVEADIAKRNFLSVVSHELRTPMNGVLGFASLLLASDLKPAQRKQVEIIQSSGKGLLALVNDILDFSKLEAGSLELEDENFSIEAVISDVVTLLRGSATAKRLDMSVFFDPRLPEQSRGDANRLRQVMVNLVGNAIKFTDSGSIGIEAREVSGAAEPGGGCELLLTVSDTGIGVPADKREVIFERFTQVDGSARRKSEGTGLGLAICKQIVDRMGGRIWAESVPGAGSTFSVRIPLAGAIPPLVESEWHAQSVAALSGRRVLVVDDHSINRRIFRLQLESYGVRVEGAANAADALSLLNRAAEAQDPFELAIIDHMMPDVGGVELARQIRADTRLEGLPLLLSSSAGVHDQEEARRLGFDAAEEKPVLPRTLIDVLRRLIGAGERRRAAGAAMPSGDGEGARLLLVEDNPVGQRLVLEMLSRSRYRVDTVTDGLEAVRAVAKLPYDLILMDIRMPVMGGVEAARRIRALEGGPGHTPIIALTANAGAEDVADYRAAGMLDVVAKPIDRDMLMAAIDAALDSVPAGAGPAAEFGPPAVRAAAE